MPWRITSLTVDDYKRVRHVAITPDADSHLILIGGRNRQGKSSTLDALAVALGGARAMAADPVRHGADSATIRIELGGGETPLIVERTIAPDGTTQLTVSDADGPMRRPQERLDKLIGARFVDPLAFLRLDAADQRVALMKIIPGATEIRQLDERRERSYKQRTDTNRQLTMARGELQRLPPAAEPLAPIDVAALVAESARFAHQQRQSDGIGNVVSELTSRARTAHAEVGVAEQQIAELERMLADARALKERKVAAAAQVDAELEAARQRLDAAAAAWRETQPRREELDRLLVTAGDHNRQVGERDAANRRRAETQATVDKLTGDVERLTSTIDGIDARKAQILAEAQLPVDGIELTADTIKVAGVPFAQAAASEQIRIAIAIAIASSPGLDDVLVRDGSLLDEESLELIARHAAELGKRVWIERVGSRDPGVIVIHDGEIAQP